MSKKNRTKNKKPRSCWRSDQGRGRYQNNYTTTDKPVFRFVGKVTELEKPMTFEIHPAVLPQAREMAEAVGVSVAELGIIGTMKFFIELMTKGVSMEMVLKDYELHATDPEYPADFCTKVKKSLDEMPDRENVLASFRAEVANFERYAEARLAWLRKQMPVYVAG